MRGYYINDRKVSYSEFRYYLFKACRFLALENSDHEFTSNQLDKLAFEKLHDLYEQMKTEGVIIEMMNLKFQIKNAN